MIEGTTRPLLNKKLQVVLEAIIEIHVNSAESDIKPVRRFKIHVT